MLQQNWDLDLVIAGNVSTDHRPVLDRVVETYNFSDRVHFLGFLPKEDLKAVYSGASVLLHPSLSEAFPLAPLEALACKLPVVASDLSGIREGCGESAYYVADPRDAHGFAKGIETVLSSSSLNELKEQGSVHVKKFCWKSAARDYLKCFRVVAGELRNSSASD